MLKEHPFITHTGHCTYIAVKTTRSSIAGLELLTCYLNPSHTRFRSLCRAYPTDPVPAGHWRDVNPYRVCLWDHRKSMLKIRWYRGFRPYSSRLNCQYYRVARACISSFAHGFVDPKPVASLTVRFERGLKTETIDSSLNHCHAS